MADNMTTLQILQGIHDWVLDKIDEETANFITKTVNDLVNYYTKSETYTKAEVQQIVDAIKQFTYEVVQVLPTASASTMNKIYLVPAPKSEDKNVKEEYITIQNGSTYSWEMLGTTSIDLSNYYTKGQTDSAISSALSSALDSYTTTADLTTLLAQKQDVIQDLAAIRSGASAGATAVQPSTLNSALSDTVAESGVYDVTANNNNAKFASLSALLGSENLDTLIPSAKRKGGMSIKFVQSSDNNYVQCRYMSSSTASADFTNVANWQGVDDEPTDDISKNLVESGGVFSAINTRVLNGKAKLGFIGAGDTYQAGITVYGIKPNTVYEVIVKNPDYAVDELTLPEGSTIFEIKYYDITGTLIAKRPVVIPITSKTVIIQPKYVISTPQSISYLKVGGRANSGIKVDCELHEIQDATTKSLTSYKGLLDYGRLIASEEPSYFNRGYGNRIRCICKIEKGTPFKFANTKYPLASTLYSTISDCWFSSDSNLLEYYTNNSYVHSCEAVSNFGGFLVISIKKNDATIISDEDMADMLSSTFMYIGEDSVKLIDIRNISDCEINRCLTSSTTTSLVGTRLRCIKKVYRGEKLYVSCSQGKGVGVSVYEDEMGALYSSYDYKKVQTIAVDYTSELKNITIENDGYLSVSLCKNDNSAFTDGEIQQFISATQLVLVKVYQDINDKIEFEQLQFDKSIIGLNKDMESPISAMCSAYQDTNGSYIQPNWVKEFFSFSVISDIHGTHDSIKRFVEYTNKYNKYLNFGICLGDIVQRQPSEGVQWFNDCISDSEIPLLFTVGNHDAADTGLSGISESQARDRYFDVIENKGWLSSAEFIGNNRCSWCIDNTTYKIRIISLFEYQNSAPVDNNSPASYCRRWLDSVTLQWFADTLYSTPSDYSVMVMLHQSPAYNFTFVDNLFTIPNGYRTLTPSTILNTIDGEPITDIVDAFMRGTIIHRTYNQIQDFGSKTASVDKDFSDRGTGKFICYISGHVHGNYILTSTDYPSQKIVCIPSGSKSSFQRKYGDINADPNNRSIDNFCCVGIDTTHKKINIIQIGGQVTNNMIKRDIVSIDYL